LAPEELGSAAQPGWTEAYGGCGTSIEKKCEEYINEFPEILEDPWIDKWHQTANFSWILQDGHPQWCLLVHKPWNNPNEY
jgi:hypothetical protein